jgi:hypothetical protein
VAEPLITGVPDTAFMVAAWRAAESDRPDALFRDPDAGPAGRAPRLRHRRPDVGQRPGPVAGRAAAGDHRRADPRRRGGRPARACSQASRRRLSSPAARGAEDEFSGYVLLKPAARSEEQA